MGLVSVVLPVCNEEESVGLVYEDVCKWLKDFDYEIIFVDDGSTDGSLGKLRRIKDDRVRIIYLKKRRGQSFALFRGIQEARGDVIVTLDADLQNSCRDVSRMLKRLDEGCDFVCGWRFERKDSFVKGISSKVWNFVNRLVLGIGLRDSSCPLKVFRKRCFDCVVFFENFHRFMPAVVRARGFRIYEEKVEHFPRRFGSSKYGVVNRKVFRNLKTLFAIRFRPESAIRWR